jgi:hypothetical protein
MAVVIPNRFPSMDLCGFAEMYPARHKSSKNAKVATQQPVDCIIFLKSCFLEYGFIILEVPASPWVEFSFFAGASVSRCWGLEFDGSRTARTDMIPFLYSNLRVNYLPQINQIPRDLTCSNTHRQISAVTITVIGIYVTSGTASANRTTPTRLDEHRNHDTRDIV